MTNIGDFAKDTNHSTRMPHSVRISRSCYRVISTPYYLIISIFEPYETDTFHVKTNKLAKQTENLDFYHFMSANRVSSLFELDGEKIGYYNCIQKLAKHYMYSKTFL